MYIIIALFPTNHIQTVSMLSSSDSNLYFKLPTEFYRLSGIPSILNTGFNLKGEPIVKSPEPADLAWSPCSPTYFPFHPDSPPYLPPSPPRYSSEHSSLADYLLTVDY